MASPPSSDSEPRSKSIAFADVNFSEHPEKDAGASSAAESKSKDDTIAAAPEQKQIESNDDTHGVFEEIKAPTPAAQKKLQVDRVKPRGPSKFLNPTNVRMDLKRGTENDPWKTDVTNGPGLPAKDNPNQDIGIIWRARDNRKGRGSMAVPPQSRKGSMAVPVSPRGGSITMRLVFPLKDVGQNILNMFTCFPYWDMAFWSGISYSIGSVLFVVDGAWAWGPLAFPSTEWPGEEKYGVPLLFFIGALFYQVGAVMAYFEAVNDGSFAGSAMRRFLLGHEEDQKELLDEKLHNFFGHLVPHHENNGNEDEAEKRESLVDPEAGWKTKNTRRRPGSIYAGGKRPAPRRGGVDFGEAEEGDSVEYVKWRWWPTWHRLKTHHIYELGYLSCAVQLFGATLYGMCGIVILPGILDTLSQWQTNAAYWIPQIVASVCFLVAGLGFTIETQSKWYKPEPTILGWWIGAWAAIGSVGFLLCASLGPASFSSTGATYQSSLSSMWGSGAYLLSSVLQWYEAVNKHPVSGLLNEQGEIEPSSIKIT